jgi:hypothetical protein
MDCENGHKTLRDVPLTTHLKQHRTPLSHQSACLHARDLRINEIKITNIAPALKSASILA